jgi:hypothetical protein
LRLMGSVIHPHASAVGAGAAAAFVDAELIGGSGAGLPVEVGSPAAGEPSIPSATPSLVVFLDCNIFPARREITAASAIPAATTAMTNTSSLAMGP